ncbi:cytochrome oxidase putative small subunit CydP [Rubrivivax gelatinosus]|uniref:Uncharacterized protein n=1 Tax=Rubrivivax gelatinosus TaxID=28068 RepID=A0A4R2MEJ1_RUBGE|nr:hypothetical protein [Rubrivivax gelatinosus]TCP02934.1 hypothetical protein EV684_105100 [Rubrivivax gelatinosus]
MRSCAPEARPARTGRAGADHRLLRHLALAVLVKLVLLAGLWWLFVRDARVDVDADTAALRVTAPAPAGGAGARP